jgi:hypothetical protein
LTLKRASKHRPGGQWSDDDYDVFDGEQHIGRIMLHPQRQRGSRGSGRSRRGCRNSHMIEAMRRAASKRWRTSRRRGSDRDKIEIKEPRSYERVANQYDEQYE